MPANTHSVCPRCLTALDKKNAFCHECGQSLVPKTKSAPHVRSTEEREIALGANRETETGFGDIFQMADDVSPPQDSSQSASEEETAVALGSKTPPPSNRNPQPDAPSNGVIRLACKQCQRKLRVKSEKAGQKIKCPKCETILKIPGQSPARNDAAEPQTLPHHSSDIEVNFQELAEQMEVAEQAAKADSEISNPRKTLSTRKYRQLSKVFAIEGVLNAEQLRQRVEALKELGHSGDSRAYEFLMADLEYADLQVRQAAVMGLGDLADSRAVPALVAVLDDHSMVMRKSAILGLGKIKDPRAIKPLLLFGLKIPQMKFMASEAVADIGEAAVLPLIELLEASELGLVLEAVVLLGRLKDSRARRGLMAVIDSRQQLFQCHAIEALGKLGDPKSVGSLIRLLSDSNANVRMTATAALSKMPEDRNIVAPLVKALKDPDEDVVIQAAKGLGECGDKRAADPLSRLLQSPNEQVRVAASQALGGLGDQRAVPYLLAMLETDSDETQIKVLTTLRTLKPPQIAGKMLTFLSHKNPAVRRRVVDVLGPIGDAEVAEQLESVLRMDSSDEVRMAAARALGEIADPASVDCLKSALHKDEFIVRCQVVGALGSIGDEECFSILMGLLEDQVPELRFHAATALGEIGNKKAIPNLKSLLKDTNPMVVRGASKSLEKLGELNVESQVKIAQRSQKMEAVYGMWETVKSYLPDSARTQKLILGGALVGVLGIGLAVWLVVSLFQGPAAKVVVRGNVQSLSYMPDGSQLVVGRTLSLVEVWNMETGKLSEQFSPPGFQKLITTSNPDVFALVSGKAVQLWNKNEDQEPTKPSVSHESPIMQTVVAPDHSVAATLSLGGRAIVWDLATGHARSSEQVLHPQGVKAFTMSRTGSLFAGVVGQNQIFIWDATTGKPRVKLSVKIAPTALAFSPDQTSLAAVIGEELQIWDWESEEVTARGKLPNPLEEIQYNPKGQYLVGRRGSLVMVWEADSFGETSKPPKTLSLNADQVDALAFSPDGSQLALGGTEDAAVWVFNLATGQQVHQLNDK